MTIIEQCQAWYENEVIEDFHKRTNLNNVDYELNRMNFAKRCCADDANLCEIISIAPAKETASQEFIDNILNANRFDVQYREQLEKTSATGTVGAYINLKNTTFVKKADGTMTAKGGTICIHYVDGDCVVPLTVENNLVTECAFSATGKYKGKDKTTLMIFTLKKGVYLAETVVFDEFGKKIDTECSEVTLGNVKPFAIMQNAEVNNIKNMLGYGLPKIYNSIPLLKAMDLCYNVLFSDLSKADKIVLINEILCEVRDSNGKPTLTPQQKEIFVMLGEKLPQEKSLIQEYNPEIRVEQITKAFELVLSLLSMSFGYGTKKYTFENTGQVKTATECVINNQQAMQELNKQRNNAADYITDIIHAAMWFSNTFCGTSFNVEEELSIEFDDSLVIDREAMLESLRTDALSFAEVPILKVWYLMEKYNLSLEEAKGYLENKEEEIDDLED